MGKKYLICALIFSSSLYAQSPKEVFDIQANGYGWLGVGGYTFDTKDFGKSLEAKGYGVYTQGNAPKEIGISDTNAAFLAVYLGGHTDAGFFNLGGEFAFYVPRTGKNPTPTWEAELSGFHTQINLDAKVIPAGLFEGSLFSGFTFGGWNLKLTKTAAPEQETDTDTVISGDFEFENESSEDNFDFNQFFASVVIGGKIELYTSKENGIFIGVHFGKYIPVYSGDWEYKSTKINDLKPLEQNGYFARFVVGGGTK